jgi:hypothetical protein
MPNQPEYRHERDDRGHHEGGHELAGAARNGSLGSGVGRGGQLVERRVEPHEAPEFVSGEDPRQQQVQKAHHLQSHIPVLLWPSDRDRLLGAYN